MKHETQAASFRVVDAPEGAGLVSAYERDGVIRMTGMLLPHVPSGVAGNSMGLASS